VSTRYGRDGARPSDGAACMRRPIGSNQRRALARARSAAVAQPTPDRQQQRQEQPGGCRCCRCICRRAATAAARTKADAVDARVPGGHSPQLRSGVDVGVTRRVGVAWRTHRYPGNTPGCRRTSTLQQTLSTQLPESQSFSSVHWLPSEPGVTLGVCDDCPQSSRPRCILGC